MSIEQWESRVLEGQGASERVDHIEQELGLAVALTQLRLNAGLSQRALAQRLGVSQPRVAAIERADNLTLDVIDQYVTSLGATLEMTAVTGTTRTPLLRTAR